jgi:outer membrane protein
MVRNCILILVLCVSYIAVHAQGQYKLTLQQCIDTALRKNIEIRQAKFSAEAAEVNLRQVRTRQLPAIYGNVDQALNLGRNVDPFTNAYVNETVAYGIYGVSGDVIIFNGSNIRNTIRQSEAAAIASNKDVQQSNRQITLNVLLAYLLVLSTEEQLAMAKNQARLSNEQLDRMELKKKKGVAALSQVTDLKGQLLNDNLAIVDLQNTLEWNKMELAQQMNIPYNKNIVLESISVDELMGAYQKNSQEVYAAALNDFAAIKAAELRTKAAEYGLKAARGLKYPQIFAGSTISTAYTSSANVAAQKVSFSNQFVNNRAANFVVGVRIPILAGNIKNDIRLADINLRNASLIEEKTKMQVWQQIERAYVAMTNAYTRYQTLSSQLEAYKVSFKAAQARFETGVDGSSVNYLIAKNNLDRANINFVNARYDFILKTKTLDFYQNIR